MARTDLVTLASAGLVFLAARQAPAASQDPNPLGLIPTPQHFRIVETCFELTERTPIVVSAGAPQRDQLTARLLQQQIKRITGLRLPVLIGSSARGIRLFRSDTIEGLATLARYGQDMPFHPAGSTGGWQSDYRWEQEYFLHAGSNGIVVVANAGLGLLYGAMTLTQLTTPDEIVYGCEIRDWPEMRFRGVHLRLAGRPGSEEVRPTCGQIKFLIAEMARFKLNQLLLEPGNGAELPSLAGYWRLEALTVGQQHELREFAKAFGVSITPVLDSWSQVQHWRSHPVTRHYLHDGRIDLDKLGTAQLLARMAGDLSRHLGTGELIHLGGRGAAKDIEAYADFHTELIEKVSNRTRKRPLLWAMRHGMPTQVLETLPAEVILMPDHPTNPRGGWYRDGVQTQDVWRQGLQRGLEQIGHAGRPPRSEETVLVPFARWSQAERQLGLWAQAVHGTGEGGLGLAAPIGERAQAEAVEAEIPQICWLAELTWNDARAGHLPDPRFDRAVGWHACGVASEGERVLCACRRIGDAAVAIAEGRGRHRDRLSQALRDLGQIHFGPTRRTVGDVLSAAALSAARQAVAQARGSDERQEPISIPLSLRQANEPQASQTNARLPLAVARGPRTSVVGRRVVFDASASRDAEGGQALGAKWEFGDGSQAHGLRATHVYTRPGTYLAGLTIRDESGAHRSEPMLVTVSPETRTVADGRKGQNSVAAAPPGNEPHPSLR